MKIEKVYKKQKSSFQDVDIATTTLLNTLLSGDGKFPTLYAVISDPTLSKEYTVNLSELLLERVVGKCTTWAQIESVLTLSHLQMYECNIDLTGSKKPHVVSVLSSSDFIVSYGSIMTPNVRNINSLKWKLTDLIISKTTNCSINFNNCLCSINGTVIRPIIYNNEMFLPKGATYLYNTGVGRGANIVLIDFTPLGGCTYIPFSYCKKRHTNPDHISDADLYLTIPDDKNLRNKTIFIAMGHTIDFLEDTAVLSDKDILISPYKWPLALDLLKSYESSAKYVRNTQIIHHETTVEKYIMNDMFDPEHYGAFVLVINHNNIIKTTEVCQELIENKTYQCVTNPDILVHEASKSIVDYTKVAYNSNYVLYLNSPPELHVIKEPHIKDLWSVEHPNLSEEDLPDNYGVSRYISINLTGL